MDIYRRVKADPADWFSPDEVAKAKTYQKPITIVRIVNGIFSLGVFLAIIATGAASTIADWTKAEVWYTRLPVVIAFLILVNVVIDLPFQIWTDFGHEKQWGFSTQTPGRFVGDQLKGVALNIIITGVLIFPLWWGIIHAPDTWWIWGWALFVLFSVVLVFLGPVVIMPLFNKFEPLEDETIAERLRGLGRAAGLSIGGVQVMDASKRTKKDNAFFTGLGKTRRVVLYDNLLEQPASSIDCVVAHELGHWKHRHIVRLMAVGTISSFLAFYVVHVVMSYDRALRWAGVSKPLRDPAALPLLLLALVLSQLAIQYVGAWHSRALERQADIAALELTKDPDGFSTMMRGLVTKNLAELAPSRLAYLRLDHPPPAERLEMAKLWRRPGAKSEPAKIGGDR